MEMRESEVALDRRSNFHELILGTFQEHQDARPRELCIRLLSRRVRRSLCIKHANVNVQDGTNCRVLEYQATDERGQICSATSVFIESIANSRLLICNLQTTLGMNEPLPAQPGVYP